MSQAVEHERLIARLHEILGDRGLLLREDVRSRHTRAIPAAPFQAEVLARPSNTAEVAQVLAACHREWVPVVPQGGLTGLVHGADASPSEVCLSMERMRTIEAVDPVQRVLVAQAGVTVEEAQRAAEAHGLLLPIDLGARGSATIGGVVSTNAGGNRVLRYGMTRECVLGLEAVLADGTVVESMNRLIKNNAGYDLKHLFIGTEGTLGIVTRVVLRLRELPSARHVAMLGVPSFDAIGSLLRLLDRRSGGCLSAFEVMWPDFYRLVTSPPAKGRPPLGQDHAFYVLVEIGTGTDGGKDALANTLASALDDGVVSDAVLAQSDREAEELWALRDDVEQLAQFGPPIGYDISLPLAATADYVSAAVRHISEHWPLARAYAFGHLGDGNVHLVVHVPELDPEGRRALDRLVYAPLGAIGGSVSAEHGVGLEKKEWLGLSRSAAEIAVMHSLKQTLDPRGILNPGRVIDHASPDSFV